VFDPCPEWVDVVGESFHVDALTVLAGVADRHGIERNSLIAAMVPEPSNPHDPHAVAVLIEDRVVGHLARADARSYRPMLDVVIAHGLVPASHATLTGGWLMESGAQANIGVRLHMGTPAELMEELVRAGLVAASAAAVVTPDRLPVTGGGDGRDRTAHQPLPSEAHERTELTAIDALGELQGKCVCFTGESACTVGGIEISRASQEILATNAGMSVLPRVTKKLDLLVVSPLAPRTGKIAKAEEYGIARVDEAAFWRALGVRID
jgi:hypothetical protein